MSTARLSLQALATRELIRASLLLMRTFNRGDTVLLRRQFDLLSWLLPMPRGVRVESLSLDGIATDVLIPDRASDAGAMMYVHGGGYTVGSPRTHRAPVASLALYAGMRVYLPDYRLAPEHVCPAALDDVERAWTALQQREPRLVLGGESAGGGLSAALCHRLRDTGRRMPEKLYLQSPWMCLGAELASRHERDHLEPMLKRRWLESQFARHYAAGQDRRQVCMSPIQGEAAGFPPTLIQVGTHETLHDDALNWARKLREAAVPVELQIGQGLWHAWPLFAALVPESRAALRSAGTWLRYSA